MTTTVAVTGYCSSSTGLDAVASYVCVASCGSVGGLSSAISMSLNSTFRSSCSGSISDSLLRGQASTVSGLFGGGIGAGAACVLEKLSYLLSICSGLNVILVTNGLNEANSIVYFRSVVADVGSLGRLTEVLTL